MRGRVFGCAARTAPALALLLLLICTGLQQACGAPDAAPSPLKAGDKSPSSAGGKSPTASPKSGKRKPPLSRSDGHRWERLSEIVKQEIKTATQKFLEQREQSFIIPLEVDLLLLGFNEDGGFNYGLDYREMEDALASMHSQRDICPTVWETGESAAVCFNINYVTLTAPEQGIQNIESALKASMKHKGNRSYDYLGDGQWGQQHPEQVYEVPADGPVEDAFYNVLIQAYQADHVSLPQGLKDSAELAMHRLAIIIVNPHKLRMSPLLDAEQQKNHEDWHKGIIDSWKEGHIGRQELMTHEAGYTYRYSYLGRGAAASWVSRHNFIVIDVSAGPITFGPQTSPGGEIEPPAMPRILPILLRMAGELGGTTDHVSSYWTHIIEQAQEGCHVLLVGQLAAAVHSAVRHLFCPDIRFERVEHARNVLVPLIALYDTQAADPLGETAPVYRSISLNNVQRALDQLMDSGQEGFVEPRSQPLSKFPAIASAIHKARVSRSDAVILKEPDMGMHKVHREYLDSEVLLRELLMAVPELSDGTLDVVDDEDRWQSEWMGLADHARHQGTRVVPVFVITLTAAPDQMMLNNRQLVAANHDAVVVLQLVKPEDDANTQDEGLVMSGHVVDGHNLRIDAAGGVTANIVAGLASSLAGMVPTYEHHDPWEGKVIQDWRWSVGAVPWGPHAQSHQLSGVLVATAKRNFFISHVEVVIRALQKRLAKLDNLVASQLTSPFAYLFEPNNPNNPREDLEKDDKTQAHADKVLKPKQQLNALTGMSLKSGYNATFPSNTLQQLEANLAAVQDKLQLLAWDLWAASWPEAERTLIEVMAAADLFIRHADKDLEAAEDAAACCSLHHNTAVRVELLIVIVGVVFLLVFVCILVALCTRPAGPRVRRSGVGRVGSGGNFGGSPFQQSGGAMFGSNNSLARQGSGSMRESENGAGISRSISRQLSATLAGAAKAFSKSSSRESLPMFEKKKTGKDDKFSV